MGLSSVRSAARAGGWGGSGDRPPSLLASHVVMPQLAPVVRGLRCVLLLPRRPHSVESSSLLQDLLQLLVGVEGLGMMDKSGAAATLLLGTATRRSCSAHHWALGPGPPAKAHAAPCGLRGAGRAGPRHPSAVQLLHLLPHNTSDLALPSWNAVGGIACVAEALWARDRS